MYILPTIELKTNAGNSARLRRDAINAVIVDDSGNVVVRVDGLNLVMQDSYSTVCSAIWPNGG